jgi:hypothetical protein
MRIQVLAPGDELAEGEEIYRLPEARPPPIPPPSLAPPLPSVTSDVATQKASQFVKIALVKIAGVHARTAAGPSVRGRGAGRGGLSARGAGRGAGGDSGA